jgi:hypothetical protein
MCLDKIFGGGGSTPQVIRDSPLADQARIDADAAAKARQESTQRKRRIRASSLLASGGGGDLSNPVTGQPEAKPTLGA